MSHDATSPTTTEATHADAVRWAFRALARTNENHPLLEGCGADSACDFLDAMLMWASEYRHLCPPDAVGWDEELQFDPHPDDLDRDQNGCA